MMNPMLIAARAGLRRGWIELRHTFTNPQDLWSYLFPAGLLLMVMLFMRDATVPGTDFSLGSRTMPSVLGMGIAFSGLVTLAAILTIDREDGTLLRAKATPNGMTGYLIGKITLVAGMSLISICLQLIPGLLLLDGFAVDGLDRWLTLAWVLAVGLVATLPLGAVFGSMISNPRNMGMVVLPMMALIGISGIFYPITVLPGWLQGIGQLFPVYWLGLGMRSALLPEHMAAVELGDSWRHAETFGVLAVWAVLGLLVAPVVLRRMARRESGTNLTERRERALRRVG